VILLYFRIQILCFCENVFVKTGGILCFRFDDVK
jgi:hypothetical protein